VEDRAPGEARNSEKPLEVNEEHGSLIGDQEEWVKSSEEGTQCPSSNTSSVVCLDRGDEEDIGPQKPGHFHMFLFKGFENQQKSVAKKSASTKWPCHYTGRSVRTMYRHKSAARKTGQTLYDLLEPVVSPKH
jgi:hypothetical protein